MAKASKPGNVAVTGIASTTTKEPTVTASGKTASEVEKEQRQPLQRKQIRVPARRAHPQRGRALLLFLRVLPPGRRIRQFSTASSSMLRWQQAFLRG